MNTDKEIPICVYLCSSVVSILHLFFSGHSQFQILNSQFVPYRWFFFGRSRLRSSLSGKGGNGFVGRVWYQ